MRVTRSTAAALVAALPAALAQTSTSCNPLNATCPNDPGLNEAAFATDFTQGSSKSWSLATATTLTYSSNGAEFQIAKAGQAPTISTDFYFFFGRVDIKMKASPGTGIISSIVLLSDDLDEIDWEFIGGNTTTVETNFFGKGNTTVYDRAIYYDVADPQAEYHTYSIDWTSEQLEWIIDGVTVRTLPYDDPLTVGGTNYPQTPMRLRLGNWAGGGPGEPNGTVSWAGGETDFSDGPFNMYVDSVAITNYNPADAYAYEGNSGSWQDIKIINGGSTSSPTGGAGKTTSTPSSTATHGPTSHLSVNTSEQTKPAVGTTIVGHTTKSSAAQTTGSSSAAASTPASGSSSPSPSSTSPSQNAGVANVATGAGSLLSLVLACLIL